MLSLSGHPIRVHTPGGTSGRGFPELPTDCPALLPRNAQHGGAQAFLEVNYNQSLPGTRERENLS